MNERDNFFAVIAMSVTCLFGLLFAAIAANDKGAAVLALLAMGLAYVCQVSVQFLFQAPPSQVEGLYRVGVALQVTSAVVWFAGLLKILF
jgi:hypothetical protein